MKNLNSFAKEVQVKYVTKNDVLKCKISRSRDSSEYARKIYPVQLDYREAFIAIYLNRAGETIGHATIGIGGLSGTVADAKVVFQHGLVCNASSVVLVHNHPSGNLTPSNSDKRLTDKMVEVGNVLDMPILDHIIITEDSYYSFADTGLI